MWKLILKQIWTRKRSNIWIALELLFVFCLTWYIVDYLFVYNYNINIPNNRDVNYTLKINIQELPKEDPAFRAEESEGEVLVTNYKRLLEVIKDYPGVENIGISYGGASPGSGSYWGLVINRANDTTTSINGQRITIDPAYDFLKVFRNTSGQGKSFVSVNDFDWGVSNGIIIDHIVEQILFPGGSAMGKELANWYNQDERYHVIGVVDDLKRFDYERPQGIFYFSRPLQEDNIGSSEISIRHSASLSTKQFMEKFKHDMADRLRVGNFYLVSVFPYSKIADNTKQQFGITNNIKLRIYLMIFFLLNILLCVMGTFWYRINQRPNEIGLHKAFGATRHSVHKNLILEGIFLLLVVMFPAFIIEYQFVHMDMIDTLGRNGKMNPAYLPDRIFLRFAITNGITLLFMVIVVTAAIWLPARKGASLLPAEALRHE